MKPFNLATLQEQIRIAAMDVSSQSQEAELVGARLMDGLRDARVPLPTLTEWNEKTGALIADEWARVEILVRILREGSNAAAMTECLRADPKCTLRVFGEFIVNEGQLLTIEVLLKSPFRIEEFARKLIAALGGSIDGESEKESRDKMERLDFGGVLKNLKAADADREVRQKKLKEMEAKRLKEQQEAYERAGRE